MNFEFQLNLQEALLIQHLKLGTEKEMEMHQDFMTDLNNLFIIDFYINRFKESLLKYFRVFIFDYHAIIFIFAFYCY